MLSVRTALFTALGLLACGPSLATEDSSSTSTGDATTGGETTAKLPTTGDETTATDPVTTGDVTGDVTSDVTTAVTTGDPIDPSSSSTGPAPLDCTELAIADPALLAAIREVLEIPEGPISGEAALEVSSLHVSGETASLAGIECLKNLHLFVSIHTTVDDLGPLAGMSNLHFLTLTGSGVTDLSPLVGLPLEILSLEGGPLSDLGPVAQIPKLRELRIDDTAVQDLTPLTAHPGLIRVTAEHTKPLDLLPLATIDGLVELKLDGCGLTDVDALLGATSLKDLELNDNQITDLDGLANMKQLQSLWAEDNLITGVAPLAGLDHLFLLGLTNNKIVDLKPLAGAVSLFELYISDNPLSGLQGLENLTLQGLTARNAGLEVLVAAAPKALQRLDLSNNKLTDVTALAGHQQLMTVVLDGNLLTELAPLEQAPWVLAGCASLEVHQNPLAMKTLEATLPALCEHSMTIGWDLGECSPGRGRCDFPPP